KILALEMVDDVDAEAKKLGAVNTIIIEAGKLRGFNTDGYGFTKAIKEEFDMALKGKRVLVLGAGGAGRAIAIQCAIDGAAKVLVANRTAKKIKPITAHAPVEPIAFTETELKRLAGNIDLLVNATSVGLQESDKLGLPRELFTPNLAVYDTIYRPAKTDLV